MRFQAIKLKYWLPVLLVAAVGAMGYLALKPSAELTGTSLESAGYSLSSLETVQFEDPCPGYTQYPLFFDIAEGDQKRRYAKNLAGSYTVIFAPMPFDSTGAELVPLMWLQTFNTADIHGMNSTFETVNGPVPFRQMAKHLVYRDKNISVFDVSTIVRSEDIETVKNNFAAECTERGQAFLNAMDSWSVRRTPSKPMLAVLDGTYRFDVISDMHRYLQENLSKNILPVSNAQ